MQVGAPQKLTWRRTFLYLISYLFLFLTYPAGIHLLKVDNKNTRTRCEICSKLTIKIPERHHWCLSGIFIVNFEHILHLF